VKTDTDQLAEWLGGSVDGVVDKLLRGAPFSTLETCLNLMECRRYRECLHCALLHFEEHLGRTEAYVFMPRGMLSKLLDATAKLVEHALKTPLSDVEDIDFVGPIDRPPEEEDYISPSAPRYDVEETAKNLVLAIDRNDGANAVVNSTDTINGDDATKTLWDATPLVNKEDFEDLAIPPISTADRPARPPSKREHESYSTSAAGASRGRREAPHGRSPVRKRSRSVRESRAFTKRLRELVHGRNTEDMLVGSVPISHLLQDLPSLEDDMTKYFGGKCLGR
jgi:hypothetical protein